MCRSREWDLYWIWSTIFRQPPLARLDRTKSTIRKHPPNGTAGFARSAVRGARRLPSPPASTMPKTRGAAMGANPTRGVNASAGEGDGEPGELRARRSEALEHERVVAGHDPG